MPRKTPTFKPRHAAAERADNIARYESTPERAEAKAFYASARWRKLKEMVLRRQPECHACLEHGRLCASTIVHHVKPRREFPALAFDMDNLIGLCGGCHSELEATLRAKAIGIPPTGGG
jgi:5-methylcytosine-specific restriction enzyme A